MQRLLQMEIHLLFLGACLKCTPEANNNFSNACLTHIIVITGLQLAERFYVTGADFTKFAHSMQSIMGMQQ